VVGWLPIDGRLQPTAQGALYSLASYLAFCDELTNMPDQLINLFLITWAIRSELPYKVWIDTVLRESGLDSICAAVGYGDQVEEEKPAPDIYLEVLQRLDVQPQYALGVEDSIAGLTSVQTAGMHSVAVVTPEYPLPEDVVRQTAIQISQLAHLTAQMIEAIVPQS
jgi:beta-phosphoglucomutase-like phosphatase (HAD superfamily)